jgi:hypothetical protein
VATDPSLLLSNEKFSRKFRTVVRGEGASPSSPPSVLKNIYLFSHEHNYHHPQEEFIPEVSAPSLPFLSLSPVELADTYSIIAFRFPFNFLLKMNSFRFSLYLLTGKKKKLASCFFLF